ncbi:MAG: MBL fold metallo-hydrolase [Deltaproteobacteria bacterium]|nr:MAG: MBL fold metallo-hydrolase [Deltaproteobacteria bacterium]
MKIKIHRGAREVGGSCVEISGKLSTILVDLGLPLDFNREETTESYLPDSVRSLFHHSGKSITGVLLSHPHLDHYGLAGELPPDTPVYCGRASWDLMKATVQFSLNNYSLPEVRHFNDREKFKLGEFTITPYLMDHSAFDSYSFLISGRAVNVFYSGDFRGHGRKSRLLAKLPDLLPEIDALLMEGTLVGNRNEEIQSSESDLEDEFVKVIDQTQGITLVTTASQNIDRLVTIFRAAKRCNRLFVIDFYTAEILDILKQYGKLPNAEWPRIRVCYPRFLARQFEKNGNENILNRHRKNGIRWTRINEKKQKIVMLVRPGFIADIKRFLDLDNAVWIYSMWLGYFERSSSLRKLKSFFLEQGVNYKYLHTSGHARITDLKEFVRKVSPKKIIPIHSFHPEQYHEFFDNVQMVENGEEIEISS